MNPPESPEPNGLENHPAARAILDQWVQSLAKVLESMTDHQPGVEWSAGAGPRPADDAADPLLWWEQPFRDSPGMSVWVAAPRAVWEHAGTVTLKAAGLETVVEAEARNTWLEILGQSLGEMARSIGAALGREIGCDNGVERAPEAQDAEWASVTIRFPDTELPSCVLVLSPTLLEVLAAPGPDSAPDDKPAAVAREESSGAPASRTMELLLDVELPVSISFGKTQLALRDVLKLMTGSIVELNRGVNDQVDVLVNHCLVARGEVVVVEGNYGVRIQEIASRRERLRSIQ